MADFYVALTDNDGEEVSGGEYQRVGLELGDMAFADSCGMALANKELVRFGVPSTPGAISGLAFFRTRNQRKPFANGILTRRCTADVEELSFEPGSMLLILME